MKKNLAVFILALAIVAAIEREEGIPLTAELRKEVKARRKELRGLKAEGAGKERQP